MGSQIKQPPASSKDEESLEQVLIGAWRKSFQGDEKACKRLIILVKSNLAEWLLQVW